MKKTGIALALAAVVGVTSTVLADRGKFDTDGDGALSYEELSAARPGLTLERFAQLDADGNGVITRDEKPKRGKRNKRSKRKSIEDVNGDGVLDLTEVQAARPRVTAEKFAEWDVNNDGLLSEDEKPRRRSREERFAQMDADGSGDITLDEMRAMTDRMVDERFARMDKNGDGVITADERPSRAQR